MATGEPCTTCIHFRRVRLASHQLGAVFDTTTEGAEIAQALGKISEDEDKLRDQELETKQREGRAERDRWPARPMTSDFCGLEEHAEIYRIWEVKNRDRCEDHAPGRPDRHACADCAHRIPSDGRKHDSRAESIYGSMTAQAAAANASSQSSQGLVQTYRAAATSRKALEISSAYRSKGRLAEKPRYLDHCGKFSSADEFVVCALHNPYHTCPGWTPSPATETQGDVG